MQTNPFGNFTMRLLADGLFLLNHQSELDTQRDWYRNLYLLPADNLVRNGGFETRDLSGWQGSDQETVSITINDKNSEPAAVRLGPSCVGACLNTVEASLGGQGCNHQYPS